jgi:hypothetical protein
MPRLEAKIWSGSTLSFFVDDTTGSTAFGRISVVLSTVDADSQASTLSIQAGYSFEGTALICQKHAHKAGFFHLSGLFQAIEGLTSQYDIR